MPPAAAGQRVRANVLVRAILNPGAVTVAVAVAGSALIALLLVVFAAFAIHERSPRLEAERQHAELLVGVLEDHATRSVQTVSRALEALSGAVARSANNDDRLLHDVLAQTMVGAQALRGLAVLDAQGRVLAATEILELGLMIDVARLAPAPAEKRSRLGALVAGRGLGAVAYGGPGDATSPGTGFVPMVRAAATHGGQARLLVALINPDFMVNLQQPRPGDAERVALLTTFEGRVLASTAGSAVPPGQHLGVPPVFSGRLPLRESGSYTGRGVGKGERIVAFRASHTQPLVAVIEISRSEVLAQWWQDLGWKGVVVVLVALVLGLMTSTAARSARAHAQARQQRDQAQAEMAVRERELSVIVKSVQALLFRTDALGQLSFVNARWQAASGLPEGQALGRRLREFVHEDSRTEADALFVLDGPEGMRTAQLMMGRDDDRRRFELSVSPLRSGGRIVGFAGSAVDVTEHQAVQRKLTEQLALTELLLEVMPLPLVTLDTQGRYTSVNRAFEEFRGLARADCLGRKASAFLPPDEARLHDSHDAELLRNGGRIRYDATITHSDGSRRDLAITKAAVPGEGGRPAGVLVVYMDVSEFRDAERATREARDAAEEASRSKSEFVANISHELRTPLQSIIGFSELGQARSGAQAKLGAMFGDIHAAGQRMLALVNDLLDVSKIESAVGTFHLERIDVRALVRDVVGELKPLLSARQLSVALNLSQGALVAKVDPMRFQQVVRNVLANAIRFSPPGETLAVGGDIDEDNRICITVADHGPGIPPDELDRIFEAFVQSSKTKDGSGGTGLGLAISRKILQAHGGEIRATNNPGGGSTFHIFLPARGFSETQPGA